MELKIRENQHGKYVIIHSNDFSEGIEFALQNKVSQIQLRGAIGTITQKIDFGLFKKISNQIKVLSISNLNNTIIENLEGIYELKNLETIFLSDKLNFELDISKFGNLTQFGGVYTKKTLNLERHKNIKTLVISSGYPAINLSFLNKLENLTTLHIYKANKLDNLVGIENLINLKEITIAHCSKINSIVEILNSRLEKLSIEKCKLLTDFSFLKGNNSIKEIFIDKLDSIEFIKNMPNLERINFWDCIDGDLTPLLNLKRLKQINFYPNKKHYSHTIEEIINITGASRGRNN